MPAPVMSIIKCRIPAAEEKKNISRMPHRPLT